MIERMRVKPYAHQIVGVEEICKVDDLKRDRVQPQCFFLADTMGLGKSKETIDSLMVLYERGDIDKALIIAPGSVLSTWYGEELGELRKHLWDDVSVTVTRYRNKMTQWQHGPEGSTRFQILVANYEFIRNKSRLIPLFPFTGHRTFLVLDESTAIKNHQSAQFKACLALRRRCGWVLLLNGTPFGHSPRDLFAQAVMLSPFGKGAGSNILQLKSYTEFKARHCIMGGYLDKEVVQWKNLDDLRDRLAPYILRRTKDELPDLPSKLPPVTLTATLTPATWKIYKDMREEFCVCRQTQRIMRRQIGVRSACCLPRPIIPQELSAVLDASAELVLGD